MVCQCLKLFKRNWGFVFRELFSFQDIDIIKYSEFKDPNVFIFCKLYEGMESLGNGLLACPKSVNGFLMCLHEFSSGHIGNFGGNCLRQHFFYNKIFSGEQYNTTIFLLLLLISCSKLLTSSHHTITFSVGNMVIQFQHGGQLMQCSFICSAAVYETACLPLLLHGGCTCQRARKVKKNQCNQY